MSPIYFFFLKFLFIWFLLKIKFKFLFLKFNSKIKPIEYSKAPRPKNKKLKEHSVISSFIEPTIIDKTNNIIHTNSDKTNNIKKLLLLIIKHIIKNQKIIKK